MEEMKMPCMVSPLTEEERCFASNLDNYNQFFKYMKIHKLDPEEWYDILIIGYLHAVKKYLNMSWLNQYDFGAILFRTLDSARGNHYKSLKTQKRFPQNGLISLNFENVDAEKNADKSKSVNWIDTKQQTEADAISNMVFDNIMENLSNTQQKLLHMLITGYTGVEIRNFLGLTVKRYYRLINTIRSVVNGYLQ